MNSKRQLLWSKTKIDAPGFLVRCYKRSSLDHLLLYFLLKSNWLTFVCVEVCFEIRPVWCFQCFLKLIAAEMSEPEASERGSSLIGKKLHQRGMQSLFLARRKELWLCANKRFRMRNGLARNSGYVRMEDLGCAVDSQGIVVML